MRLRRSHNIKHPVELVLVIATDSSSDITSDVQSRSIRLGNWNCIQVEFAQVHKSSQTLRGVRIHGNLGCVFDVLSSLFGVLGLVFGLATFQFLHIDDELTVFQILHHSQHTLLELRFTRVHIKVYIQSFIGLLVALNAKVTETLPQSKCLFITIFHASKVLTGLLVNGWILFGGLTHLHIHLEEMMNSVVLELFFVAIALVAER
mmetsp:Transcript_51495/g.129195  ORF Transcript_51495/g.129195 Transcript_51495/m.129195 type:complete len:205 (+) Transcript_51495:727-1341(+)